MTDSQRTVEFVHICSDSTDVLFTWGRTKIQTLREERDVVFVKLCVRKIYDFLVKLGQNIGVVIEITIRMFGSEYFGVTAETIWLIVKPVVYRTYVWVCLR